MGSGQKRLNIVAAERIEEDPEIECLFRRLWSQWQKADEQLACLAKTEDDAISLDQDLPSTHDSDIDDVVDAQNRIIEDLLGTRASNLDDVRVKLKVWLLHTYPGKIDPRKLSASDKLIFQAIRELNETQRVSGT